MDNIINQLESAYSKNNMAKIKNLLPELFKQADNGLIIELPCKVGDMVYVVAKCESVHVLRDDDYFTGTGAMECPFENQCDFEDCADENKQIFETTITDFWYGKQNGKDIEMFFEHLEITASAKDFDKTVFLTRAEAEKALIKKAGD